MTVDEIFSKIAFHMIEGMMVHDEIANAYDFLGLYGFSKYHAYHHLEETKAYMCLQHYYSVHFHKLLNIDKIPQPDIIPQTWYKYSTNDVDTNTKRQAVQMLVRKWVEWETATKKLYEEMYSELLDLNEIAAAEEIKCYILCVVDELKHAEKKLVKLETIEYNIGTIISWQQPMYKKYKKLCG